jgi:hypothetical protein
MKKSLIAVATLVMIIALLPIVGNTVIKKTIDERVVELASFGIETQKNESKSSYLSSSRHFEFLLKDSEKFVSYLKHYSDKQIPSYVTVLLDGVVIGADVKYSNLPFAKVVEIELYPLALSSKSTKQLKQEDINLYNYIKKNFALKKVLYHINYNFLNDDFDGYIKDINEKFTTKENVNIELLLKKATFKGNGRLLAPEVLSSSLQELNFLVFEKRKKVLISLKNFSTKANFASKNTYLTSADLGDMKMLVEGTQSDFNITLQKVRANVSANALSKTAELNSKTSLEVLDMHSNRVNIHLKKFNFDVALSELNKEAFEKTQLLMSQLQMKEDPQAEMQLEKATLELLSAGFLFRIADFSLENLTMNSKNFQGFEVESKLKVDEEKELAQKMAQRPFSLLENINLDTKIVLSKMIYGLLVQNQAMLADLHNYAIEKGDSYLFHIKFTDSKATINDKALK